MNLIARMNSAPAVSFVSPLRELGAYEALWDKPETTFKTMSEKFAARPGALPSDFVPRSKAREYAEFVQRKIPCGGYHSLRRARARRRRISGETARRRASDRAALLSGLVGSGGVALASRSSARASQAPEGIARTRRLVQALVKDNFTIVSGLAAGVDTVAHETAIEDGGRTIAVIGTPLSHTYPRENAELQRQIAREFLLISQVPVKRYERQDYRKNRLFFPERNITMSALTEATIIVEAGETSGTLDPGPRGASSGPQAVHSRQLLPQRRLTWPQQFADKGAIRVVDYDDIRQHLSPTTH